MTAINKTQMVLGHDNSSVILRNGGMAVACDVSRAAFNQVHSSDYRLFLPSVTKISRRAIDLFRCLFIFSTGFRHHLNDRVHTIV